VCDVCGVCGTCAKYEMLVTGDVCVVDGVVELRDVGGMCDVCIVGYMCDAQYACCGYAVVVM